MSVYRQFSRDDILFSVVSTRPRVSVAYGETGWRGSTGVSASLSLYGGVRSRRDVRQSDFASSGLSIYPLDPLDTHSIDKVVFVSGSYPSTGSIRFVRASNDPRPSFTASSDVRWYDLHFRPIELLYSYYCGLDSCYFTGSYDAYTALLLADRQSDTQSGSYFVFSGSTDLSVASDTSSFTAEIWFKPLLTGSTPIVMGQPHIWSMGVGEEGQLILRNDSPDVTFVTGTQPGLVEQGVWNHLAVAVSGGQLATFYVNGANAGSASISTAFTGSVQPLVIGALVSGSTSLSSSDGFVFESRLWSRLLTENEIQRDISGTLHTSGSASGLVHYARFNDGPHGFSHGFANGSGAFDHSPFGHHGYVVQYSNMLNLHWQPSDHPTFRDDRTVFVSGALNELRLFHVPSLFYGKQIEPGSVRVTDGMYNTRKIIRVFQDDGRGSLYVSGSMTRDISGEEYTGERRRKVGNVFYSEGLVVFTDPALWDMFDSTSTLWNGSQTGSFPDLVALDFRGQGKIYTKTFNCRMPAAEVNASNNPTFSIWDDRGTSELDDDIREVARDDGTTYVTAVGLYNEERVLIAVAKLAQPIRKREKDKINIRLKMDF